MCAPVSAAPRAKKKVAPPPPTERVAPASDPSLVDPPPLVPVPEQDAKVTRLQAAPDLPATVVTQEQIAEPVTPEKQSQGSTLLLGVRAGAAVPLSFLRPGYLVGLELQYRLPILEQRLRLGVFGGRSEASGKQPRLVPGRGSDPAFIQNIVSYPVEGLLHVELLRDEGQALTLGAGYGAVFVSSQFIAVGTTSNSSTVAHSGLLQLAYRRKLGPGEAALAVQGRAGAGDLGALGRVGTQSVSSIETSLSWAVALLP